MFRITGKVKVILLLWMPVIFSERASAQQFVWEATQEIAQVDDENYGAAFNNTDYAAAKDTERYIVWEHSDSIMIVSSIDNGVTWNAARSVYYSSFLTKPVAAVLTNGDICVAWQERISGSVRIRSFISQDKGQTWSQPVTISTSGSNDGICLVAGENNKAYASWHSNNVHVLFSTFSNGIWSSPEQLDKSTTAAVWSSITSCGDTLYAVWREGEEKICHVFFTSSFNGGMSWDTPRQIVFLTPSSDPSVAAIHDGHLVVAFQSLKEIYAVVSSDFGTTFSSPVKLSGQGLFARVVGNESGFFGIAYERLPSRSTPKESKEKELGFVYTMDFGMTFSEDKALTNQGGKSFSSVTMTGDNEITAYCINKKDGKASVIVKRGLISNITNVTISAIIPEHIYLLNYPNPFNPTTNIVFSIARQENVTLTVFNIQGREIATLVDESLEPGEYSIEFNNQYSNLPHLSSGTYFYQLITPSFSLEKSMTLIK